ncbi:hypothetical protein HYH03_004526 [Edaphochlamys debaryana]|uniref:Major facilitator superfamily (MFS) profile domain-containing protein n=1 Tax=Edaphochlamys debaryana TaxID=47281 RepID=A0A836C330_9CHLO|nr:hypothetical protein HYH03_004526 [Edaphochlamys debaryana]|eukprot:KAG2497368.1 hypothetical protein HYH03_004526 [Edaphochlamys debaryana]
MAMAPVLPYLVDHLGAKGSAQYGRLQTLFSTVQFVGGLISGPLMDRYGGRWLLAVSFAASTLVYLMTASATSLWMLYASRLPTVMQHSVLAARAIVTQLSSDEDRARVLGYVAVSYSVGFTVGPAIGGRLSAVSLQFSAWVATAGSALSLISVLFMPDLPLPNEPSRRGPSANGTAAAGPSTSAAGGDGSGPHAPAPAPPPLHTDVDGSAGGGGGGGKAGEAAEAAAEGAAASSGQGGAKQLLLAFVEVARRPGVGSLLVGKVLVGLGSAVFQSLFAILLKGRYGLDPEYNGYVLSYVGLLLLLGQALLVGPIISAAGEPVVEYGCVAVMTVLYGALAACSQLWELLVLMAPLSVAGMLYANASTSRLTKAVLPHQRGTALAVDMSLSSGVRMLSPTLGAWALDSWGHRAVPGLAAALIGLFWVALGAGAVTIPGAGMAALWGKVRARGKGAGGGRAERAGGAKEE